MPTVWLGRGVSNNVALIEALKKISFSVVVSHISNEWAGSQYAKSFQEPDIKGIDYVNWTANIMKEEGFDYFIPGRCLGDFSHFPEELKDKLIMGCSPETSDELDNKALFYKKCKDAGFDFVADFQVFNDSVSFANAYGLLLKNNHERFCFKPSKAVFAQGFRILTNNNPLETIQYGSLHYLRISDFLKAFTDYPDYKMEDMILMPLFNGKEISVDGSFDGENYRMVARLKNGSSGQKIILDNDIYDSALKVAKLFNLKGIFNIQFMYHNEKAMLLEVNPRPAGGIATSLLSDVELITPEIFGIKNHKKSLIRLVPDKSKEIMSETVYYEKINKINYK